VEPVGRVNVWTGNSRPMPITREPNAAWAVQITDNLRKLSDTAVRMLNTNFRATLNS